MIVAGIDIGSVGAKAILLDSTSLTPLGQIILPSGWDARKTGELVLNQACQQAAVARCDITYIVGTGYGRIALPFANKVVTEITCHALGAYHLFPSTRVILDIGGQDSKVISIDENGAVCDFMMNDKCAAGTGRFLQMLSTQLQMDLTTLSQVARSAEPVAISNMCAVFAETEIIGLLAKGTAPESIAAGVFLSIARRMRTLARRISFHGQCTFTGGLAKSRTFASLLEKELGVAVNVPDSPQVAGALGAALIAARQVNMMT